MNLMFDAIPLWLTFALTLVIALLAAEIGFRAGIYRTRKSENERQAPIDAMVGSTLGLLAFVLAFTFGMAASRYDARQQLVLEEAITINSADLSARLLPEPHRSEVRALLGEYVDVRLKGALVPGELPRAISRSVELLDELWSRAAALEDEASTMPFAPALTQAVGQMIEMHWKRVNAGVYNRLPGTIWIGLYCMMGLGLAIAGYRAGVAGPRSMIATLISIVAFSTAITLITDIDRPQEGLLKVSQQAMVQMQARLRGAE